MLLLQYFKRRRDRDAQQLRRMRDGDGGGAFARLGSGRARARLRELLEEQDTRRRVGAASRRHGAPLTDPLDDAVASGVVDEFDGEGEEDETDVGVAAASYGRAHSLDMQRAVFPGVDDDDLPSAVDRWPLLDRAARDAAANSAMVGAC